MVCGKAEEGGGVLIRHCQETLLILILVKTKPWPSLASIEKMPEQSFQEKVQFGAAYQFGREERSPTSDE